MSESARLNSHVPGTDENNKSPIINLSSTGQLQGANAASWLILESWRASVGEQIPEPWAEIAQQSYQRNSTTTQVFTLGFVSIQLLFVPDKSCELIRVFGVDVSSTRQAEKDLIIKAHVYSQAQEAVVVTDAEFRTIDINPSYTRLTGYDESVELGEWPTFLDAIRHDADRYAEFGESLQKNGVWHGETWTRTRDGDRVPIRVSISAVGVDNDVVTHYVAFVVDITSYKAAEEQLYRMAHYDGLTGLPNRYLFADQIHNAISRGKRTGEQFAVMLVDLDGFKRINDNLGHRAGDRLLDIVGQRITNSVRDSDLVARFGGDEFAVLVRDLALPNDAVLIARKILAAVSETSTIDGAEVYVTASIGIALYPRDQTEIEPLLQKADSAMYRIKSLGKNDFHFFSDEFPGDINQNLQFQTQLRRAIEQGEIQVHYQPQIETVSGRLLGVEALARWNSGELGEVPPDRFIPLAEEFGLIHQLGESVLRRACRQGADWKNELGATMRMGVNVSARQLRQKGFSGTVARVLEETGLAPSQLELELTETVFVDDISEVASTIKDLADIGVNLAIDDFGTRYASLLYIKTLPVNRLKIDRIFIKDLPEDSGAGKIVTAIVALGHSLGCDIVAEGVESREQVATLREMGCLQIQGFVCSPALPAEDLERMISSGICDALGSNEKRQHVDADCGTVVEDD